MEPEMKYAINVPARSMVISFKGGKKIDVDFNAISESVRELTFIYGAKQKISDAAASALKLSAENGTDVEEQRYVMASAMYNRLLDGTAFERVAGEGTGRTSYLVEAVAFLYSLSDEIAAEKVAAKSDAEKAALVASPKIAAKIADLKREAAERAAERALMAAIDDEDELPVI
jgi:hypothetical protein